MTWPFIVQAALLAFYVVLTVAFALKRETLPMSLYYAGCLVKDSGVLILGWLLAHRS